MSFDYAIKKHKLIIINAAQKQPCSKGGREKWAFAKAANPTCFTYIYFDTIIFWKISAATFQKIDFFLGRKCFAPLPPKKKALVAALFKRASTSIK